MHVVEAKIFNFIFNAIGAIFARKFIVRAAAPFLILRPPTSESIARTRAATDALFHLKFLLQIIIALVRDPCAKAVTSAVAVVRKAPFLDLCKHNHREIRGVHTSNAYCAHEFTRTFSLTARPLSPPGIHVSQQLPPQPPSSLFPRLPFALTSSHFSYIPRKPSTVPVR